MEIRGIFSILMNNLKGEGVLAEVVCTIGSKDLKFNFVEPCWQ
jgi:hypothetical protein